MWMETGWNPSYENTESAPYPPSFMSVEEHPFVLLLETSLAQSYHFFSEMFKIAAAPVFTSFDQVYPGPHINSEGKIDPRVWFSIRLYVDTDSGDIVYLVFPYGGTDDEITEVTVEIAE